MTVTRNAICIAKLQDYLNAVGKVQCTECIPWLVFRNLTLIVQWNEIGIQLPAQADPWKPPIWFAHCYFAAGEN